MTCGVKIVFAVTCTVVGTQQVAASDITVASEPRVRVLAPAISEKAIVGHLVESEESTLTLRRADGQTLNLQRASVTRFERSLRPSRKARGATIGALVGLGLALGAGAAYCSNNSLCDEQAAGTLMLSLITVPAGALLGLAVSPGEKWVAEDPKHVRVRIAPGPNGGVGMRLAVAF